MTSAAGTPLGPPPVTPRQQQWASAILRRNGWRLDIAPQAYQHPKYVLVGAYHTTNWDAVWAALGLMAANIRTAIIIKKEWTQQPFIGPLITSLGGVGVQRGSAHGTVRQIVDEYNARRQFVIGITPEGTRGKAEYWKSGFYLIARKAQVPLLLGYLDYPSHTFGIAPTVVWPSGDLEGDMAVFLPTLATIRPKYPEMRSEMRFAPPPD